MKAQMTHIPEEVLQAFPILKGLVYIRQMTALIPLYPDTVFHLFAEDSGQLFTLVVTDHPDPIVQSEELLRLSGEYQLSFAKIITPYTENDIIQMDNIEESGVFFVPIVNSKFRCYLAATTSMPRRF